MNNDSGSGAWSNPVRNVCAGRKIFNNPLSSPGVFVLGFQPYAADVHSLGGARGVEQNASLFGGDRRRPYYNFRWSTGRMVVLVPDGYVFVLCGV